MQEYKIPWGQWHEQGTRTLRFPDDWEVHFCAMPAQPTLTAEQIIEKLDTPIGTEKLEKLAKGKKSACIIIDDISRPTRGDILLPPVIEKLTASGMDYSQIKILVALGGHRPMTKQEMRTKVGDWVLERVRVINHNPFADDLVNVADDRQIIKINRHYMEAELKIAVGCIVPHTLAGFSGGAKAVIPGIGGIETLHSNHTLVFEDKSKGTEFKNSTCDPDNPMRQNMEEIVGKVGLDFIVNAVLNPEMQVGDLCCGHFIKAHRAACEKAKEALKTKLIRSADIVVTSAFPKDTEFFQVGTATAALGQYKKDCVKPEGSLVMMTASSEGAGFHYLFGPGMDLYTPQDNNVPPAEIAGVDTMIYSDGITKVDVRELFDGDIPEIYSDWNDIIHRLMKKYEGKKPVVAIYPMAAIQIGCMEE